MKIYRLINLATLKQYIGMTSRSPEGRFRGHCRVAEKGSMLPLHCAIRKYGKEYFLLEILEECKDRVELQERERYYIAYWGSMYPDGYNLTKGGDGFSGKHSKAEAENIRRRTASWWAGLSEEYRKKVCDKISTALKGKPRPYVSEMASKANKGRVRSEEFKRNASEKMKAYARANREEMARRGRLNGNRGGAGD